MRTEKLIIRELKSGNCIVFEKIFHEHYNSLVNFAHQFLFDVKASEDTVQGVFLYFWENSEHIKLEKPIKSYLYKAVKNSCLNQLRALKIRDKHELLYLEAILKTTNEELKQDEELFNEIKSALSKLPKKMAQIFYKKYFQELSINEIANQMDLSENTVKVQLHRGRNTIREKVKAATGIYLF